MFFQKLKAFMLVFIISLIIEILFNYKKEGKILYCIGAYIGEILSAFYHPLVHIFYCILIYNALDLIEVLYIPIILLLCYLIW